MKSEKLLKEEKELDLWAMAHPEPDGDEAARLMADLETQEKADGPRQRAKAAEEFAWMVKQGLASRDEILKEYPHQVTADDLDAELA